MQLVRFRVDLAPGCSLGPGKIALLDAIATHGSLTRAAAALGMSYRYAWLLIDDLKGSFSKPVTAATVGGKRGGGVELTPFGRELLRRYRAAYEKIEAAARRELGPLIKNTRAREPARAARSRRTRSIKRGTTTGAGIRR
jgi:molybdate transport system regulatory protein